MPGHAGFDSLGFPGLPEMQWLKANTNLDWCGYYLAPAPSRPSSGWMGQRAALMGQGWGIAALYVGEQVAGPGSLNPSAAKGSTDGNDAATLMASEGFAAGRAVYLDLENGLPFPQRQRDYVEAWANAVQAAGFTPGVYCSHFLASDVAHMLPAARIWAFKVPTTEQHPFPGTNFPDAHPSGSGFVGASIWQCAQNCKLNLPAAPVHTLVVDLDTALTADPGA